MTLLRLLLAGFALLLAGVATPALAAPEGEKAESAAHHDDTDLGHANAGGDLHNPTEIRYDLALATFIVFALLLALLWKLAWGPISEGLDKREQHIATMIADAERNQRETEARLRELEARLAAQAEEAREAISAARREGELVKEKVIAEAQAAAEQEKVRAINEIRTAKNVALREIAQKTVDTAMNLAKNVIHREVRPDDHAQLIREALAQFNNN